MFTKMFVCTSLKGKRTLKREVLTVGRRGKGKFERAKQKTQEPIMPMERAIELAIEPLESMFPGSILGAIKAELTAKMQDLFRGDKFYRPRIIPGRRVLDVIRASADKNGHDIEFRRKNAYLVRAIKRARREADTKNSTVVFLIGPIAPDRSIKPDLDFFTGRRRLDYNLIHPEGRKIIFYQRGSFTLESI